jgi:polyphenol oxidase
MSNVISSQSGDTSGIDGPAATRRELLVGVGLVVGSLTLPATPKGTPAARADHASGKAHVHKRAPQFAFSLKEPPRQRKSFVDLSDDELRRLCQAVGYLRHGSREKPLPLTDPLQWDQFALAHAHHCTDQGAVQVHWSWFFLPWHRAFLYFFERNLAHVLTSRLGLDGSKFALPYWDWENHKEIPNTRLRAKQAQASPFFGYDLDADSLSDPLPFDNQALWDGYRAPTPDKARMDPKNEKGTVWKNHTFKTLSAVDPRSIRSMLQLPFYEFAGQPFTSSEDGQGLLEKGAHNLIHDWVGSRYGSNRDMGTLRYAALDPLFYLHHANVDRIWSLYRFTPDPDKVPAWGKQWYNFYDAASGKEFSVTVADTVKRMTNVTYTGPEKDTLRVPGPARKQAPRATATTLIQKAVTLTGQPLKITTGETKELKAPPQRDKAPAARALLEFDVTSIPFSGRFSVNVFVNKADADAKTSVQDKHYVGSFGALDAHPGAPKRGREVTHKFLVDVSPDVSNFFKVITPGKPFTFTLVPEGAPASLKNFKLTVKKVTLRVYK